MKRASGNSHLYLVIALQVLLCFIGFQHHFQNPQNSLFYNQYDGYKNYFTYYSYVVSDCPDSHHCLMFDQMNYPYGDFITYTDNTPALSIPLKGFYKLGILPKSWVLPAFNYFLIFSIIISTIILWFLLEGILKNPVIIAVASLSLPWINPQLIRLTNGHFNLSQSWLILLIIYLMYDFHNRFTSGRSLIPTLLAMTGTMLLGAAFHIYYLLILGIFLAGFFVYAIIKNSYSKRLIFPSMVMGIATLIISISAFYILDPYLGMRSHSNIGFDYPIWRLDFSSLLTAYPWFGVDFIIQSNQQPSYESYSYLGGFVLYGGFVIFILHKLQYIRLNLNQSFLRALILAGVICLLTAIGTRIQIPGMGLHIENVLNPLYWVKKVWSKIEHFRCLGRFNWPFFWVANILILIFLDQIITSKNVQSKFKIVGFALLAFLILDAKDAIRFNRSFEYKNNLLTAETELVRELSNKVDPSKYEAILTIPYNNVGSQVGEWTMDSDSAVSQTQAQLSARTDLPLMASLMSRTPMAHAEKHFKIFTEPSQSSLEDLKTNKPLLILANEKSLCKKLRKHSGNRFLEAQIDFLYTPQIKPIFQYGDFILYEWDYRSNTLRDQ